MRNMHMYTLAPLLHFFKDRKQKSMPACDPSETTHRFDRFQNKSLEVPKSRTVYTSALQSTFINIGTVASHHRHNTVKLYATGNS